MAGYWYVDSDLGDTVLSGNTGSDWANAISKLDDLLNSAVLGPADNESVAAGEVIYIRASATSEATNPDTYAVTTTLTTPGTLTNPVRLIGVVSGTTRTGASVVAADMAVLTGNQPVIQVTGAGNDLNIAGSFSISGVNFDVIDRLGVSVINSYGLFHQCDINADEIQVSTSLVEIVLRDCEVDLGVGFRSTNQGSIFMYGGEITGTITSLINNAAGAAPFEFTGVDLSAATITNIVDSDDMGKPVLFRNCRFPSSPTLVGTAFLNPLASITCIGCSNLSSKPNSQSYQDYEYEDAYGSIVNEPTIVRTGGATDEATGTFSYALTPHANATLEGSTANLASPWMSVWVAGGAAITLTVYVCNSSASTDYNRDEMWCEFYTPDAGDTAQYDQTFDHATDFLLDNSTAITDDTGSTWGTGGNNHQKFSATVTPGYEGFAYARVHVAKRQATPDTVYVDPKIVVT